MDQLVKKFTSEYSGNRNCFVIGATGEVGKRLCRELITSGAFAKVKIISRNTMPEEYVPAPPSGTLVDQVVIEDFWTVKDDDSELLKDFE